MGEYAKYNGQEIKIGTCEDMYYLRWDQAHLVQPLDGNVDPIKDRDALRFRFPFPEEDRIEPGQFNRHDKSIGLYGVEVPEGVEHHRVQFASTHPTGHLVMLPCPESVEGKASGLTFQRNGYSGSVQLVQQRWWEGRLVLVAQCGGCGSAYRYPTFADVEPIVVAIRARADQESRNSNCSGRPDPQRAEWWSTIADRIEAGYAVSVTA